MDYEDFTFSFRLCIVYSNFCFPQSSFGASYFFQEFPSSKGNNIWVRLVFGLRLIFGRGFSFSDKHENTRIYASLISKILRALAVPEF